MSAGTEERSTGMNETAMKDSAPDRRTQDGPHALLIHGGTVFTGGRLIPTDVLVRDGRVLALGTRLLSPSGTIGGEPVETLDATGLLVSPGLVDPHVHYRDPGQTYKETIRTGSLAAARGGFTTVGAMANIDPTPDTPGLMERQCRRNAEEGVVRILQYSPITKGRKGAEPVDFAAQRSAGAFAFSDDGSPVQDAGVLYRALRQARKTHSVVAEHIEDEQLLFGGVMAEGERARALGLPGKPACSEYAMLARDLLLAQATGGHLHVCHVSTAESVTLLRLAKERGLPVTAEATPHHLLLTDTEIPRPDSYYRMNPPLRHERDREALVAGLADGTIDLVATDHAPHAASEKPRDRMEGAANGITGSETAFQTLYTRLVRQDKALTLVQLLHVMTDAPARVFGIRDAGILEPGAPADIALFDLNHERTIDPSHFASKGVNTPFANSRAFGATVLTMVGGRIVHELHRFSTASAQNGTQAERTLE